MKPENFIAFFTICGFFAGICFCILRLNDAVEILIYTLVINFAFYIIVHIAVMNFIDAKGGKSGKIFDKYEYEEKSNELIAELDVREKKMAKILESVALELDKVNKINRKIKKAKRQQYEKAS